MIYNNVELHNIEELLEIEGRPGLLMQRIPEELRAKLRPGTQLEYRKPAKAEIRFVSGNEPVTVKLVCPQGANRATLYYGDFQATQFSIGNDITEIVIPPSKRLMKLKLNPDEYTYSPLVRRLILADVETHLVDITGNDIRPPEKSELPMRRYLAYGTSITQGHSATSPALSYAAQTAWRLKADLINLGAAGNAFCEKELADYIAAKHDWDIATFCISVNMYNQGVDIEEFAQKTNYMLVHTAAENPGKPVVCISMLPFFKDKGLDFSPVGNMSSPMQFRDTLKSVVENTNLKNLHYIDGRELMPDYCGLSTDLIHPGDMGMIQIAENLTERLKLLI